MNIHVFLFMSLLITSLQVFAESPQSEKNFSPLNYINELRTRTGMRTLEWNHELERAAKNHANYCVINNSGGHFESEDKSGFTGSDPFERVSSLGYLSRSTGENVSFHKGDADYSHSIDGLMSAIYHRFGFLSFDYNEMGSASAHTIDSNCFVYNMGNTDKNALCMQDGFSQSGKYYSAVCADKKFRISAKVFDGVSNKTQLSNPELVLWPAKNSSDIPPAFFNENPDPLPNYSVSGYPVSIQFNPAIFAKSVPVIHAFTLVDAKTGETLELIKHIKQKTDEHNKFTAFEHAIFPVERLNWGHEYHVYAEYVVANESRYIDWSFKTRELGIDVININGETEVIHAKSGVEFAVYLHPEHGNDVVKEYRTQSRGLVSLDVRLIDGNTLAIKAVGTGEAIIIFHGVSFKVVT